MALRCGRARRGARDVGTAPRGHWKATTFIAAQRHSGLSRPALLTTRSTAHDFLT
jgi:hypothetical protein